MRKIITFLGRNPRETQYQWDSETCPATVFPQVLRQRLAGQYDQMLVFVTQEAKEEVLVRHLNPGEDPKLVPVDIPTPRTETEHWTLFECLTEKVDEGDAVIFDITHGFRSIPFLVFLAAAYLKAAKGVTIEGIYYGALEMGPPAPVIDLTPFASLLDWLAATNQFIRTGSAADLAQVLKSDKPQGRSSVRNLADKLEGLSLALMLCRPLEAMEKAEEFKRALEGAGEDVRVLPAPFRLLLDRLRDEYAARALADPEGSDARQNLRIQLDLLSWYVENSQVIQAMTLAREWVISALAWRHTGHLVLDKERDRWEEAVNNIAPARQGKKSAAGRAPVELRLSPEEEQEVRKLWGALRELRNDLAHAGMRPGPARATKIVKRAKEIRQQIRDLAVLLGVCDPCPGEDSSPEGAP